MNLLYSNLDKFNTKYIKYVNTIALDLRVGRVVTKHGFPAAIFKSKLGGGVDILISL